MAIESQPALMAESQATQVAIENELPSYRAISAVSVCSLFFGALSVFCFANPWFLVAAGVAIALGALALHRIARQTDVLTGSNLARIGIVLGLVCGLSSVTFSSVQSLLLKRRAEAFIRENLMKIFQDADVDSALWYGMKPNARIGVTTKQIHKSMETADPSRALSMEHESGPIVPLMRELKKHPQATVRLDGFERTGEDKLTPFAIAVMRVIWPESKPLGPTEKREELVALVLKCEREGKRDIWWIEQVVYPYQISTYEEPIKPVDDGHGHAH